jgi:hypothetical protein
MADPQLMQSTVSQTSIPDYAKPFVEDMLGNAQSITDPNVDYQQYMGDRVAQFMPLQNQAFGNAATMQTAPQLQDASALAGMAGLGALNTQYTYKPSDFGSAYSAATTRDAQGNITGNSMMNPFKGVMDAAAYRNAQIQNNAINAQATLGGAFGGSRNFLMQNQNNAELQRNLGKNQFDAYNQAQTQYNTQNQLNAQQQQFGAGLGLQGLQTANTAASNLANIGQTQYGQNMGINAQQAQYGGVQQQQVQNQLNNQYQDFLNYQNNPYKQISFMSDILRGLPMQQSTGSVYQTPPSMVSQAAGLGVAGLGLSKLGAFAGGGMVNRPAGLAELAIHNMG